MRCPLDRSAALERKLRPHHALSRDTRLSPIQLADMYSRRIVRKLVLPLPWASWLHQNPTPNIDCGHSRMSLSTRQASAGVRTSLRVKTYQRGKIGAPRTQLPRIRIAQILPDWRILCGANEIVTKDQSAVEGSAHKAQKQKALHGPRHMVQPLLSTNSSCVGSD